LSSAFHRTAESSFWASLAKGGRWCLAVTCDPWADRPDLVDREDAKPFGRGVGIARFVHAAAAEEPLSP
jgi:hypothetical protein